MSDRSALPFPDGERLDRAALLSGAVARYRALIERPASEEEDLLRQRRHRAWLSSAVPALLGGESPKDVCAAWSSAADALLREPFIEHFPSSCALFALGKLGSGELNLSSDVDIVVVSKTEDPAALTGLRRFQKSLSETRATGFALRTDFDLRPGGRMGALVPTLEQFTDWYGNYGETWERMAFVRLRPIAGDPEVIRAVMDFAARFSFRRHLDFNLLDDLNSLRSRIHAEHWRRAGEGKIDLKLGVGGIRDVELFFHALQVIHGGKDPSLRTKSTTESAALLAAKGLLPATDANFLISLYWDLRQIENYVQALGDEQTHIFDPRGKHPDFIASFIPTLGERMERCDRLVASLLGEPPKAPSNAELRSAAGPEEFDLEAILAIPLLSRHRERDEATRRAFLGKFIEILREQKADAASAIEQLKDFLKATRAKADFFALLLREEPLLRQLAWIFGHSRYLGRLLCFRPELLDAFVFRAQDLSHGDLETLLESLVEKRLLAEIIEGGRFLRDRDLVAANEALTSTADGIVVALTEALTREYPTNVRVLALGKWGGRETGFRSDLDFIFVSPQDPTDADHRFSRRLISRLTEPHRGGNIYPIDMRLRPSGKAGPVIMPAADLEKYLRQEAAAWEKQAYLRARWIGEDEPLIDLRTAIFTTAVTQDDLRELDRIRQGLLPQQDAMDLKYSEGGLVDLELFAQTVALQKGLKEISGRTPDALTALGFDDLRSSYEELRRIEQLGQLVASQTFTKIEPGHETSGLIARLLGLSGGDDLARQVHKILNENSMTLHHLDPRRRSG